MAWGKEQGAWGQVRLMLPAPGPLLLANLNMHVITFLRFISLWVLCCTIGNLHAQFKDHTVAAGIGNTGQNRGVAVVDFDLDGWEDLYFSRLDGTNPLYRNNRDGTFTNVAASAGLDYVGASGSAVWGDLNNDGYPDLVLGNRRETSRIYLNNADGTFDDITLGSGVVVNAQVMSVNLADVDQDGWLDIYFANLGEENALYLNNGDGTFSDVTYSFGALDKGVAMGAIFFDYDRDGDPDLYLTHDANQPNILYKNVGGTHFVDASRAAGLDLAAQGMGVDVADIDQDGWLDVYITNLYENVLFRNLGNGSFENIVVTAGVSDRGMGWGTVFLDYDNDGLIDIYVANETNFGIDYRFYDNVLYRNRGDLTFEAIRDQEAIKSPYGGYGVAAADLDKNGWIDLVIANSGSAGNQLLLNEQQPANHWLRVRLEGRQSNRSAVGARVELEAGDLRLTDEVIAGSGFAGQNSLSLHFGLGEHERVDRLRISWPSGLEEVFENLDGDQTLTFIEQNGVTPVRERRTSDLELTIKPNPVVAQFQVQLKLPTLVKDYQLSLYSAQGHLIYRDRQSAGGGEVVSRKIDVDEDLPAGMYYLEVMAGSSFSIQQVLLLKR